MEPICDAETLRRHHAAEPTDLVGLSGGAVGGDLADALRDALVARTVALLDGRALFARLVADEAS